MVTYPVGGETVRPKGGEENRMGISILVVEDEPDVMHIITHALKAAGHTVVQAWGGEDAVRKAKTMKPDLVLTDLAMPEVSGVAVIHDIKQDPETAAIPVIAVTAHVWDSIAQAAGKVGVDGFISKPFTAKELVAEVEKQLRAIGKTSPG